MPACAEEQTALMLNERYAIARNKPEPASKETVSVANGPERPCASFRLMIPIESIRIERFNGKFWDNCLNQHGFMGLADSRRTVNDLASPLQPQALTWLAKKFDARRASEASACSGIFLL